jgi:hypothetical protein
VFSPRQIPFQSYSKCLCPYWILLPFASKCIFIDPDFFPGKSQRAYRYLREAPRSHFESVTRDQFFEWLDRGLHTSRTSQAFSSKRASGLPDSRFHVFAAAGTSKSASHRGVITPRAASPLKRQRTDSNEKPPCLRCKILKKRVRIFIIRGFWM